MKKAIFAIIVLLFIVGCAQQQAEVVSEKEGVESGTQKDETSKMSLSEAVAIALDSECIDEGGILGADALYNSDTETWWIDLELEKEGCNPACVVDVNTEEASINWRCTGLIE